MVLEMRTPMLCRCRGDACSGLDGGGRYQALKAMEPRCGNLPIANVNVVPLPH